MKALLSFFLCVIQLVAAPPGKLKVTWLDMPVHGLAVIVETPTGKVFCVDTGGVQAAKEGMPDYNAGRDAISPYLKANGYSGLDAIFVSHPHGDHYGGVEWLLENLPVRHFYDHGYEGRGQTLAYTRLRALAQSRGAAYQVVNLGATIELDPELKIALLSPPLNFIDPQSDPTKVSDHGLLNSNSLLLRVQHGECVFLFPGDAYGGGFEKHLKSLPQADLLHATVLTAPHHGFNPGIDFPKMVSPKFVVASCLPDYPGNAGTPHPRSPGERAEQTYTPLGAQVYVTAFHGTVTAVSDGKTVQLHSARSR